MNENTPTQSPLSKPEVKNSFREEALETVRFLIIALIIVVPIRLFIAQPFIVSGASMDPTFANNQYLIVDELSYRLGDPVRGDVAIFKFPKNPKQYFIKRIIGVPGDTVQIDNVGLVTITNKAEKISLVLNETYVERKAGGTVERTLKENEYFMMGDNRAGSFDSRSWGPVNRNLIVGKAFLRLFPLTEVDVLPGQFRYTN